MATLLLFDEHGNYIPEVKGNTISDEIEWIPVRKFPKNGRYRAIEAWLEEESLVYNYQDLMTDDEEQDLMNLENDILEEVFANV